MKVLKLVRPDNKETIEALQYLAEQARKGVLVGVAICYCTVNGDESAAFTGKYKAHPEKALGAAMRLSWTLTQMSSDGPS